MQSSGYWGVTPCDCPGCRGLSCGQVPKLCKHEENFQVVLVSVICLRIPCLQCTPSCECWSGPFLKGLVLIHVLASPLPDLLLHKYWQAFSTLLLR